MNHTKTFKQLVILMIIGSLFFVTGTVFAAGGNGSGGGGGNGSGGGGSSQDTTEIAAPEENPAPEDNAGSGNATGGGKDDPLTLLSVSPEEGANGIALDSKFELQFNKNVVNIAVKENNLKKITLWQDSTEIPIDLQMVDDQLDRERRDYITVIPKERLQEGKTYTLKIDNALQAKSGSVMPESRTLTYTTLVTEKPFNMMPLYLIIAVIIVAVVAVVIVKKNKKN